MEQQTIDKNIRHKNKDDEEFKTIYCCCFKIPWFRKEKNVSVFFCKII